MRIAGRKKMKISGYKTTKVKSNRIGVNNKFMPNKFNGGGWKWTDKFRNVLFRYM